MVRRNDFARDARLRNSLQFRFIFSLSFVFHLVGGTVARLRPTFWQRAHRSILIEAWEASGTIAQLAFVG